MTTPRSESQRDPFPVKLTKSSAYSATAQNAQPHAVSKAPDSTPIASFTLGAMRSV
jgi:hypothetical protein